MWQINFPGYIFKLINTLYFMPLRKYFHKYDDKNQKATNQPIWTCQGRNKQCRRKVLCGSQLINKPHVFPWTYCGIFLDLLFNFLKGLRIKLEKGLIGKALTFVEKSNTASWYIKMTDEMKICFRHESYMHMHVLPIDKFICMNICRMLFIARFPISLSVYLTWSSSTTSSSAGLNSK